MICILKLALEIRDISLLALLLSPRLDDISPADSLMCKNFDSYLVLGVTFCQATEHACEYLTRLIFESVFYHNNHHGHDISTAKKLRVIFGQVPVKNYKRYKLL